MKDAPPPCPICSKPAERQFHPFCSAECSNTDLDRVVGELVAGVERLAEDLLGAPSLRKPRTMRWGTKGALVLELHGRKRGSWYSHEAGQGGGVLHLIAHARSCNMAEAIGWARDWTGGTPDAGHDYKAERAARQAERDRKARETAAEDAKDAAKRMGYAGRLWARSSPVAGTVAERYLLDARRVPAPVAWPGSVRFHKPTHSLILGATAADGTLRAVQRVRLTADAQKAPGTLDEPTKISNGVLVGGGAARLPGPADGPLLLAEGPETGLSVWVATGHETWVALGGMGGVPLPAGRRVVACRDDDPKHSPADRKMVKLIEAWRTAGHQVAVATPWPFRAYDKTDFNDAVRLDGAAGVRRRIEAALNPGGGAPARLPIKQVREHLRAAVAGFFDGVRAYDAAQRALPPLVTPSPDAAEYVGQVCPKPAPPSPPPAPIPVYAIRVDVGAGKTLAAMLETIRLLAEMRAAGDMRSAAFVIPTHALGDELASIFAVHARGRGLTAAVYRGMEAVDPDSPSDTMCRNLEAVQDAKDAVLDVFRTTCQRKLKNGQKATCPFFAECGYQRQRNSTADLWIVPHDLLFIEKPAAIGKLAFLVVDESVFASGLEGVHGKPTMLSLDAIGHMDPLPTDASLNRREDRDRLDYLRNRLLDVLRPLPDGPLSAEAIEASDLSLDNAKEAHRLEWARRVEPEMHPGMSKATRREAVRQAAVNATIPRFASAWEAVTALLEDGGPQRSGWASLAMHKTDDGPMRVLHLKGRRKVRKGWIAPTLLIDATMNVDLVRPFWPDVRLTAELLADAPHQRIRQVVDRSYGKSAIEPMAEGEPHYSADQASRRHRGLRAVHAIVNREARSYGGAPVLVVAQKAVREALPAFGSMAPCIDLAHHNAVAGRDQWRNVRALVVVGRTQPAPASVERLAEALTGGAVEHVEGWYARGDGVRHTAATEAVTIEADRHPDPVCEAIRWQVCEGQLVQIIGRVRGVNRTEADPVDVLVLTDAPLPLPVAATLQAADLAPSPDDLMLAAGGMVLENAADVAAAYPSLWTTREAAKKALQRQRAERAAGAEVGDIPVYKTLYTGMSPTSPGLVRSAYQVAGAGKSPSVAWCDPALVPDPAAWLAGHVGMLAWCRTDAEPDPPPSPSAPVDRAPRPPPPDMPADPVPAWPDDPGWQPDTEPADLDAAGRWAAAPTGRPHPTAMTEDAALTDMQFTNCDQAGLDPARVYARGAVESPCADEWSIRLPGELPIRIRGRPGALTEAPRLTLLWPGLPSSARRATDCSAAALLPDAMASAAQFMTEPRG